MNLLPDSETEIRRCYSSARLGVPDGTAITVLQIGAEQTVIASGEGIEPSAIMALGIGSRKTSNDFFKHNPPKPAELENAIMTVEDEVTRARAIISERSVLFANDEAVHGIALIAGLADQPALVLHLEAVESTFDRLAAVALGRPAAYEGLPTDNAFAATLLILREFMHHLNFSSISVSAGILHPFTPVGALPNRVNE